MALPTLPADKANHFAYGAAIYAVASVLAAAFPTAASHILQYAPDLFQ